MNCQQTGTHTIKPGDSLYNIAQMHNMTVPELQMLNPGINPYNLQVGSQIIICRDNEMNHDMMPDMMPGMPWPEDMTCPQCQNAIRLYSEMRQVWSQHVYWVRMLLISIASDLADQKAVTARILQNPQDIGSVFGMYYPQESVDSLVRLLTEHLQLGAALITAWKNGDMAQANELNRRWYMNADQMAAAFAGMSPYYQMEEVRSMLYNHLGLTIEEIGQRLAGNYAEDIAAFDRGEQEVMDMADYFSMGILKQFSENLCG